MSLIPNKKNKKDKRNAASSPKSGGSMIPGNNKVKTHSKGAAKSPRLTGGSQRGV